MCEKDSCGAIALGIHGMLRLLNRPTAWGSLCQCHPALWGQVFLFSWVLHEVQSEPHVTDRKSLQKACGSVAYGRQVK